MRYMHWVVAVKVSLYRMADLSWGMGGEPSKTYKNPKPNITPTATFCLFVVCRFSTMRVGSAYVIKSVKIFNAAFER
jgi:hypothetical protein